MAKMSGKYTKRHYGDRRGDRLGEAAENQEVLQEPKAWLDLVKTWRPADKVTPEQFEKMRDFGVMREVAQA